MTPSTPRRAVLAALLCFLSTPPLTSADTIHKRHVQLVNPTPYNWDEYGPTNPLNPDGSDYPCKVPQGDAFVINGTATEMAIGAEQTVSFAGWAVHGGGSCQFALTEGHAPTKDSAWKVIHSIEGGCPKANVTGNLEPGQDPDTYTFTIPDDFAPGEYTWAWTWVNRIAGSPEFYMNCAPITVTEGAGTTRSRRAQRQSSRERTKARAAETTYPDLFLANIGSASNGCTTSEALYEQVAIAYPHPGNSVSYPNGQDNLFPQACDGNPRNNGAASAGPSGAVTGQPSASTATAVVSALPSYGGSAGLSPSGSAVSSSSSSAMSYTTTAGTATATATALPTTLASTLGPSGVATSPPSSSSSSSSFSSSQYSIPVYQTIPAAASSTASAASPSGTTSLTSPCTDGLLLCVDGDQFSTCTGGEWDTPQNLALNTTCEEEGPSVGLNITYHWD